MGKNPSNNHSSTPLKGLNPLGLLDGVMGGQATDWEPPMAEELEPLFPGYHDFQFIDRGGMGAVYSAMQRSLERRVAVKILPPEMGQDTAFVDRFHQEARLLARLQHPHIVAVYDFGRNASGHLFIVMEYVEGTSLLDVMKVERIALAKTLEVTIQVCEALQFAHDHGVIHRDIKPTNILIDVRGCVRVADFGLAKLSAASQQSTTQSRTAMVMGTPGYAAPEQRRGEIDLDHRADIFSVGVTLYELVTGHLPVGMFDPPSKKSEAPAALDKIVIRSLRERPAERYQRASEMRAALKGIQERMAKPLMQRAIAKRPIVSMMTSVIVGAGFIYLLDALNTELLEKPKAINPAYVDSEYGPTVLRLDDTFSLVRLRLNWEEARRRIKVTRGMEMASLHSETELRQVTEKLRSLDINTPIWTGGWQHAETGEFRWDDGSAFDFEAWMPPSSTPPLVITEFQAKNRTTLRTKEGLTPDWIEVHNPGQEAVDLSGWRLRHFTGNYAFEGRLGGVRGSHQPERLLIQPGEYRLVYCTPSDADSDEHLAFSFQLEAQTGRLNWADPQGHVVQSLERNWSKFPPDSSLIWDEKSHSWAWSERPTPGQVNAGAKAEFSREEKTPKPTPQNILLLPDFEGRWTLDTQRRTAWSLVRNPTSQRQTSR